MTELLARQKAFFRTGATLPLAARQRALANLENGLIRWEGRLLEALQRDLNKSPTEGYATELGILHGELRSVQKQLPTWCRHRRVPTPLALFPAQSWVQPQPYGVALILAPWNYPIQLTLAPLISALAAGNCGVVKPSEDAPHCSHALAAMLGEIFPPELVAVVEGGKAEATRLLALPFDYIFFTGSAHVGRVVMEKAAAHLTPITLELGGKSPAILTKNCDVPLAAKRLAWAKFLNAGQTCVAPDHVYCRPEQLEELVVCLKKYIRKFYGEIPINSPDWGRIINEKHFDRLVALLGDGTIATGGETRRDTLQIAPTVLTGITQSSRVMGEEIFGPILPILTYTSTKALVALQQQKPKPLALYLFTKDLPLAHRLVGALPSGGVCIGDSVCHLANPNLPFGGIGESGMGVCHGKAGFDTFTHQRGIVSRGRLDLPLRYPPYGKSTLPMLRKIL